MSTINDNTLDKLLGGNQMDLSIELSPGLNEYIELSERRARRVRIVQSIPDSLDRSWEESYADKYLKHSYYRLLQDSLGEQFDHYFLILEKGDGKSYVQPVFLVRQNILDGLPASLKWGMGGWMKRRLSPVSARITTTP